MASDEIKITGGQYDPHQKKAKLSVQLKSGGPLIYAHNLPAEDYPAGEPAQQKRIRADAAKAFRDAADFLDGYED